MSILLSKKIRQARSSTTEHRASVAAFSFKDIEGLKLNSSGCMTAAIFLQYVQHFGFDHPGILKNLNSNLITMALRLFEQPVHPTMAPLYEQLFSLSWRNISAACSAHTALSRKSDLHLPRSVAEMPISQAFKTLKEKGLKLEMEINRQSY